MSEPFTTTAVIDEAAIQAKIKAYLSKVYTWMAVSMAITAGSAIYAANDTQMLMWGMEHPWMLFIALIGTIMVMSFGRNALSATTLGALFLVFSAVEGLTLAPLLILFSIHSLGITFACTAGMFGGMALWGLTTKRDLSSWGSYLCMGLLGLIIAGVVNIFWGNGIADLVISFFGVLVFCIFTAYDTQKLVHEGFALDGEERSKAAVLGALALYLDFINLFLYLLRFLGNRD